MNYTPVTGWYYVSPNNRSASWTGVEFFANFLIGAVYVIFILFIVGAAGAFLWVDISQEIPGLSLLWIVLFHKVPPLNSKSVSSLAHFLL